MTLSKIHEALIGRRLLYISAALICSLVWLSARTLAQNSFKDYDEVQQVLASSTDSLPPELKSTDSSAPTKGLGGLGHPARP